MFPHFRALPKITKEDKQKIYTMVQETLKGETIEETIENINDFIDKINPNYEGDTFVNESDVSKLFVDLNENNFNDLAKSDLSEMYYMLYDVILSAKPTAEVLVLREELGLLKELKLHYVNSSEDSKKAKQNRIIEIYKTMILQEDNIKQIMTPLDHEHIKNDATNIAPPPPPTSLSTFELIQDIMTKYSFLAGLAGVGQEANAFSDYAMGLLADIYYEGVNLGKRGHFDTKVGLTKFDSLDSLEISDVEIHQYVASYNKREPNAKKHITFETVKRLYSKIPITNSLSAIMNAFVDIAKDPYITNVNWEMMSTNVGNMLLRAGVHPFVTMAFMAQPIIREYLDFTSSYESKTKDNQVSNTKDAFRLDKVRRKIISENNAILLGSYKDGGSHRISYIEIFDAMRSKGLWGITQDGEIKKDAFGEKLVNKIVQERNLNELNSSDLFELEKAERSIRSIFDGWFSESFPEAGKTVLDHQLGVIREQIFNPTEEFQRQIFKDFLRFTGWAKKVNTSVKASLHAVNGYGKNPTSALIAYNKVKNTEHHGVINYKSKMKFADGSNKLLGHHFDHLIKSIKVLRANPVLFPEASRYVQSTYNQISIFLEGVSLENEELGDKLDETFMTYVMSDFAPLQITAEQKQQLVETFPKEFGEFRAQHRDKYFILDQLQNIVRNQKAFVGISNKSSDASYTDKMKASFEELLENYPETALKLIQYSFITSGFYSHTLSYHQFIPESFFFKNDFNGHLRNFTAKYKEGVDSNFIENFFLSNVSDNKIVPMVNSGRIKENKTPLGTLQEYQINIGKDGVTPPHYIKTRVSLGDGESRMRILRHVGFNDYTTNPKKPVIKPVYTEFIENKGGVYRLADLKQELAPGINLSFVNSNELDLPKNTLVSSKPEAIAMIRAQYNGSYLTPEILNKLENDKTFKDKTFDKLLNNEVEDQRYLKSNVQSTDTLNIYSTDKNGFNALSNMAKRPFKMNIFGNNIEFNSVEQYYQYSKWDFVEDELGHNEKVTEDILESDNVYDIKKYGRLYKGFKSKEWNQESSRIMKEGIIESFKQNPEALELLLSTGDTNLTHNGQVKPDKWTKEFPKILMEVRDIFKNNKIESINQTIPQNITFKAVENYMIAQHGVFAEEVWDSMTSQQKEQIYKNCI